MKKMYASFLFGIISFCSFAQQTTSTTTATVQFDNAYINVNENDGTATLSVSISEAPTADATIDVSIMTESTAVNNTNYTYSNETLTFTPTGNLTQTISITLNDNTTSETDTFLALELINSTNSVVGENSVEVIYILDDEPHAQTGANSLDVQFVTSYAITGASPGSEIVAHDPVTERLFVMNSGDTRVEILDFSDPLNITSFASIDFSSYGNGGTSVAVMNNHVAVAITAFNEEDNGSVVFMNTDGTILTDVGVGVLPDMITFSPDGNLVLTANEGQPLSDYSIDPEGTVSVIDISGGISGLTQANVNTLNFNAFDSQMTALKNAGVRIFGPGSSVSEDLEPEYISISENSQTAWVTLQENNAVAVVDLTIPEITDIFPLGLKDHSLHENSLDVSNKTDFIFMGTWPVKGMYMPDGITNYSVGGTSYFLTANEGDAREYDALEEEVNLENLVLDPTVFPNQNFLQREANLGKINISSATGDTDGDGDYDEIHVLGGRSFSIFNGTTGALVYDSGDDFERIIAADSVYGVIFNTTDEENEFKNRSDNKGVEPEAVIVKEINGAFYAFIALERVGGFMVYDVSDPNAPVFEGYFNNRGTAPGENVTGDLAPESIIYIAADENSEDKGLLVIANEISATISVYSLENDLLETENFEQADSGFKIYPNPVNGGKAFFGKPQTYLLFDLQGRKIASGKEASFIDVDNLQAGIYIVKTQLRSQKLIVK